MIKSANQYPVHALFSFDGNVVYRIPAYQREYSWRKTQWENLFQDLVEADGAHFLGTVITLNQTVDATERTVLEIIDGQQRATTLTLLLAAVYSVLSEHRDDLDEDTGDEMRNLGRRIVTKSGDPRVTPQTQGSNLDDYLYVLRDAGLKVNTNAKPQYYTLRQIAKCLSYFRTSITTLAESEAISPVEAALRVLDAAKQAILVKIEVESRADAFVLFASLNNRGKPLTPVDLIKNHLLAEAQRRAAMNTDDAFALWNEMLTNLGDSYVVQERFLRHYYNAFKTELPDVPNAPVATKTKLIHIYERLLADGITARTRSLVNASRDYGRLACVVETDAPDKVDESLRRLMHAQGAPSYVLLMWLMSKRDSLAITDGHLVAVIDRLTSFFVRRNLTGSPQTYALPKLFMTVIDKLPGLTGDDVVDRVAGDLSAVSSGDEEFRSRLGGPVYDENSDVTRFILTTLSEDAMTTENRIDLWKQEKGHYTFTIEHILPQGPNLPEVWVEMLGGATPAKEAKEEHEHRLGNLTLTAYNSALGNKSFAEKRDRTDSRGRPIGYRNGLALNTDLATREQWTVPDIEARTTTLVDRVIARFPLT